MNNPTTELYSDKTTSNSSKKLLLLLVSVLFICLCGSQRAAADEIDPKYMSGDINCLKQFVSPIISLGSICCAAASGSRRGKIIALILIIVIVV